MLNVFKKKKNEKRAIHSFKGCEKYKDIWNSMVINNYSQDNINVAVNLVFDLFIEIDLIFCILKSE